MDPMTLVWLVLLVGFLILEGVTPALVAAWFAGGALSALIISLLGGELWLQIVVFVTVTAVLLISLRPLVSKYLKPRMVKTNLDAVIGTQGIVTEDINNVAAQGRVKLGAMEWSARSTSGHPIAQGTLVKADKIEGVKVFVTEIK